MGYPVRNDRMNPIKFGEASMGGNPELSPITGMGKCRDLMVGSVLRKKTDKGKSRLQIRPTGWSSENCSGKHNQEVTGSNPVPAKRN